MLPLLLAASAIAFVLLGVRQARRQATEKRAILTPCLGSLTDPRLSLAPDGYPRASGRLDGRECRLAIIPDTLTLRRLPQLWLTVALSSPRVLPSLVVTARPRGDDYVSKAFDYPLQIDVPSWLPRDVMIRVGTDTSYPALELLRGPLAVLFEDPLVKELSLDPKGFRLVYRLAEGERANHLLLRQCRFSAQVDETMFDRLRESVEAVEAATIEPIAEAA